jgi:hypothetical protein
VVEQSACLTVPPGTSLTSAIIINTYLGAVAARGSIALCISVAGYQATGQQKRGGLTFRLFLLKKSRWNGPRTRPWLIGLRGCLRFASGFAVVLSA